MYVSVYLLSLCRLNCFALVKEKLMIIDLGYVLGTLLGLHVY